jgi:hypothetical protein
LTLRRAETRLARMSVAPRLDFQMITPQNALM